MASSRDAKRVKVDPTWAYAAVQALASFATRINDYGSGGTVARIGLENARYAARIFAEMGHLSHEWQALERKYHAITKGRRLITISNLPDTDKPVDLEGVTVQADTQHHAMLKRMANLYHRQFEAQQVKDLPDKDLHPRKWASEKYKHAEAWMTQHEQDCMESDRAINGLYQAWPYDQPDALEVFSRLLLRYGVPYLCNAWPIIRGHPLYWALLIEHQDTFVRSNLESCMRVRTDADLHDYAPFWSSPGDYLLHILRRDDDPTPVLVQSWCAKYDRVLTIDTLREIFTTTKREFSSTTIELLMKFGYLPTVNATEDDPWHYFYHYLRLWGIRH